MTDFVKVVAIIAFTVLVCTLPVWSSVNHSTWTVAMLWLPVVLLAGPLLGKLSDWMDKGA